MEKDNYEVGQNNRAPKVPRHGPGRGMRPGEKAKNFKGTWAKLLTNCKKYWGAMIFAIICAGIGTVLTLIGPDKLSKMTDLITEGVMTGIDMDGIKRIGITLICFYGCSALLSLVQNLIMGYVTQQVSKGLRSNISRKINRLPMWFYNQTSTGDVLSRVTNDVDTIAQSFNQSMGNLVTAVTLLLGSLIMMIKTNIIMTVAAILSTLLGFVFMALIMSKSQKYFARQQMHLGEINGHVEEIYAGHTVVKAYNGEKKSKEKFDKMNENLRDSAFKAQCLSGLMMPLMTFIGNLGYVAVCIVGALLVMNDKISFGVIIAFMMYVRYFTQPLSQIAQAMQALQSAAAAGERVFEFTDAEEMEDESTKTKKLNDVKGEVSFEHVKFGYKDSDKVVIHDFSAVAKPGQKVAIVGPTGAGKTTMVNLLMRFHEILDGDIKIDGVSIKDMTREEVHDQFCMVLQDTWLYNASVRDNIRYGKLDATEEEIQGAARAAYAHHFIETQPGGYDMEINEESNNISQGQKQLLTIARAILADPKILILDEATSSVDTRTEERIQMAMDNLMQGRTSFVIAHRLSTIKDADVILVMNHGDIVEQGNHEELLAQKGFYYNLYNSQFAH